MLKLAHVSFGHLGLMVLVARLSMLLVSVLSRKSALHLMTQILCVIHALTSRSLCRCMLQGTNKISLLSLVSVLPSVDVRRVALVGILHA